MMGWVGIGVGQHRADTIWAWRALPVCAHFCPWGFEALSKASPWIMYPLKLQECGKLEN